MPFEDEARNLAKLPMQALLASAEIRRRIAFEIGQNHYDELNLSVPLSGGLSCPVTRAEHWHSFSELFVDKEMKCALERIPLPNRWIDLGCHAGYFSLLIVWLRKQQQLSEDFSALLVDADPRVKTGVDKLITINTLMDRLKFQPGVVASGQGNKDFSLESVMSSSVSELASGNGDTVQAPIVSEATMMQLLPPPYDLVKVDIEGSEFEFFQSYPTILKETRYLLLEWHSWHKGGGGGDQIRQLAFDCGFELVGEPVAQHQVSIRGKTEDCGTILLKRRS